jgi:hypothetical protein
VVFAKDAVEQLAERPGDGEFDEHQETYLKE